MNAIKRAIVFPVDFLILAGVLGSLLVVVTGGGVYALNGMYLRIHSTASGLYLLFVIGTVRLLVGRRIPFLAIGRLDPMRLPSRCDSFLSNLHGWITSLNSAGLAKLIGCLFFLSFAVKVANAWCDYGFLTGDDVEIHEMTFAKLFDWKDYHAWDLRNAFYPLVFIYPMQAVLKAAGMVDPAVLVFGGRFVVILFSLFNLWLVYRIAAREFGSEYAGIFALLFLMLNKLHVGLGSTELPRTVSSCFVLIAFWFLFAGKRSGIGVALGALALGVGAAIRFSEAIFFVPALLCLALEKRFLHAMMVALLSAATGLAILGVSDLLYWGKAFYSLIHIVDYTLVQHLSSRGYQPFNEYVRTIGSWTNLFALALFFVSIRLRSSKLLSFFLIPLLVLSLLPHKEPRYILPAIPFYCALAGGAFWQLLERNMNARAEDRGLRLSVLIAVLLAGSVLLELDGLRTHRSVAGVDMARFLGTQGNVRGAAVEQLWRAGGKIYLSHLALLADIDLERTGEADYIRGYLLDPGITWLALRAVIIRKYDYAMLIQRYGFQEIPFPSSADGNEYRLFHRVGFSDFSAGGQHR